MVQLSTKAPLINSISMQTHRRWSFLMIRTEGTNTLIHMCTQAKQCVLYWKEKRDTLSSYFIWSISLAFSLFSHSLTHPSSPWLLAWMCLCFRSVLQGNTHPSVCRCYCSLFTLSETLCECVVLWACAFLPVRVCVWVSETTEYWTAQNIAQQ